MSNVIQISVFMDNKHGRLSTIAGVLADANVNIFGFCVADSADFGIIRLVVDDYEIAVDALKKAQMSVNLTPILLVKVDDVPGGAKKVFDVFSKLGIDIEYSYGVRSAIIAFGVENGDCVQKLLQDEDITLIDLQNLINQ